LTNTEPKIPLEKFSAGALLNLAR